MFEFLVTTVLVGVLVALKKLFSRLAALSHESDVLKRRLDSMRQDLTGVTVALRANATGETLPGEGRRVNLGAILDLDRRLNELSERLKGPIETPGESGAIDRESQVHPSLPPLPSEEAMPPSTAKETEPFVPESAPPILVPDANKTLPPPVPVLLPQQPHRPQSPQQDLQPVFDWESFTGVKLFAWLGGVALFLGAAFFVKYSIEHSLISPMLRIILGLLAGSGLLAGGMWMRRQGYETTVHTLCASGIAILYVDIFTDLPNARSMFLHLEGELARCKREGAPLALLVCDLDGFKQVNDRFGHLEGNRVLQLVGKGIKGLCRQYDCAARMGGDEFVLVLPGLKSDDLQSIRERLAEVAVGAGLTVCGEP